MPNVDKALRLCNWSHAKFLQDLSCFSIVKSSASPAMDRSMESVSCWKRIKCVCVCVVRLIRRRRISWWGVCSRRDTKKRSQALSWGRWERCDCERGFWGFYWESGESTEVWKRVWCIGRMHVQAWLKVNKGVRAKAYRGTVAFSHLCKRVRNRKFKASAKYLLSTAYLGEDGEFFSFIRFLRLKTCQEYYLTVELTTCSKV